MRVRAVLWLVFLSCFAAPAAWAQVSVTGCYGRDAAPGAVRDPVSCNNLAVGLNGQALVDTEGQRATFSGAVYALVPAVSNPTDVFVLAGSASKVVRVTDLSVSCEDSTATAGLVNITLVMRSTADSGGTSAAVPLVYHDPGASAAPAATAAALAYTANPTLGTAIGIYRGAFAEVSEAGPQVLTWDFGSRNEMPLVLRGTAMQLAVNFNSAAAPNYCTISVTETESAN